MHGFAKKSVLVLLASVISVSGALPAFAQAPAPGAATGLAVSTPAGNLPAQPGTVVDTWLRVVNQQNTPIAVTILPATVKLENNGVSTFQNQEDPRFAGQVTFSTTQATVPASGYIEVKVKVAIPTTLIPDIYLLGFLVTPEPTPGDVRTISQIGALIALDVPGSRDRALSAEWLDAPLFIFNDHPELNYRASSTGKSALQYTSEAMIDGYAPVTPTSIRRDPLLVPSGLYRDANVAWSVPWGVGLDTVTVTMLYPQTQSGNAQVVLTKTVLVMTKMFMLITLGVLLLFTIIIVLLVRRRRNRKAQYADLVRRASGATPVSEESISVPQGGTPTITRTRKMDREESRNKPRQSRWRRG